VTAVTNVVALTAAPGALSRALDGGDGWVWLLAPGVLPRPGALERLTAAIEPPGGSRAVIVAGVVVDPAGALIAEALPAGDPRDDDAVIRLARARVLPIRSTPFAHCLVDRRSFAEHGLPDERAYGPQAAREWSARVLRQSPGYLAAASIAVLERPERAPTALQALRALSPTLRMTRTGAWTRGESAEALADLARAALRR
jgi:hypothetical protein